MKIKELLKTLTGQSSGMLVKTIAIDNKLSEMIKGQVESLDRLIEGQKKLTEDLHGLNEQLRQLLNKN